MKHAAHILQMFHLLKMPMTVRTNREDDWMAKMDERLTKKTSAKHIIQTDCRVNNLGSSQAVAVTR